MSNTIATFVESYKFDRVRTLGLLESIQKLPDPQQALLWRPGPGRAYIGWQLMHIGITEDIFASERLAPHKPGRFTELWPRFRGGSKPDDRLPPAEEIRKILDEARADLLATLAEYSEDRLGEIPAALKERGLTIREVLDVLGWHEAHHQGQAHLTLNLFKAAHQRTR
jgi:uncharacterized damage-inducible protein DinB